MMKRMMGLGLLGMTLVVGCATATKPATPEKTAYFEYNFKGQPYVFGSVQEMQKFVKTKTLAKSTTEYLNGYPVIFDASDPRDVSRLVKEYEKAHK